MFFTLSPSSYSSFSACFRHSSSLTPRLIREPCCPYNVFFGWAADVIEVKEVLAGQGELLTTEAATVTNKQ